MTALERNYTAKAIRGIRKILQHGRSEPIQTLCTCHMCELNEAEKSVANSGPWYVWLAAVLVLCFMFSGCNAFAYTDEQIANAIYLAEGGKSAKVPYGILSVKCTGEEDCRRICLNTIRNNRIRYTRDVRRNGETYLSYLSRKYAPIGTFNDPQGLNRHWLKNVTYFLRNS